jgi:hypothetical protein
MNKSLTILAGKVFSSLTGSWHIERHIVNKLKQGMNTCAAGNVIFANSTDQIDSLFYLEQVHVNLNSQKLIKAFKRYKYTLQEGKLFQYNFFFVDNVIKCEKMYELIFCQKNDRLKAEGEYLCGADVYKARYEFESLTKFQLTYEVRGKNKFFSTYTNFTKL